MVTALTALAVGALWICNIVLGPLNQDEGWYLLSGLQVATGALPYRDFFFTQGPVLPFIYGLFSAVWSPFGVLGGRLFTAFIGAFSVFLWASTATRMVSRDVSREVRWTVALMVVLLTAGCPVYNYFTVITKTYALSGLWIALGFFALTGSQKSRFELAGVSFALAAGTRISLGILLAVVGLGLLMTYRREGYRWAWFRFGLGGGLALLAIYGPFVGLDWDSLRFSQTYHASRTEVSFMQWILLRVGSCSRLVQGYWVSFLGCLGVVLMSLRSGWRIRTNHAFLLAGFLATSLLHLSAPFPYDDYQTPVMPLLIVPMAVTLVEKLNEAHIRPNQIAWAVWVTCCFLLISSPLCMDWVMVRKDRFWVEMKDEPDLMKLRRVGAKVRDLTPPDAVLLTQDAYVAVEAQRAVLQGLEMGPFSLFPGLTDEAARRHHVHNIQTLQEAIERAEQAPLSVMSGYSFAVSCPTTERLEARHARHLWEVHGRHYEEIETIDDFGQGHTQLVISRRRVVPHEERELEKQEQKTEAKERR